MHLHEAIALLASLVMAISAGLMGAFAHMRRMSLAADALSHVALPGIGVALLLGVDPLIGAVVTLLAGALLIWQLEQRTHLATDAIIGVVFASALALGSMITRGEELIDALFGDPRRMTIWEATFGVLAGLLVIAFILRRKSALVLALVSPEIAHTSGVNEGRLDLEYLMFFALTVAMGLRFLGALLMGSLIIIPAAAARRLATGLNPMLSISAGVAVLSTTLGDSLAQGIHQKSGPVIVLVGAAFFLLSLLRRRS